MTVDDRRRLELHRQLENTLGREHADTLMAHLPPVTWDQVATKDDLASNRMLLRADIESLGNELRAGMAAMETGIRTDMTAIETGIRTDMTAMETGFRSEMLSLRTEMQVSTAGLRTEMVEQSNRQLRWIITFAAAWSTLLLTAVQLVP